MSVVVNQLGYAEYDYATRAYAEGVTQIADGLQFQALIRDVVQSVGLQHRQKISVLQAVGAQWQARIQALDAVGMQFQAKTEDETLVGAQFRGLITTRTTHGVQLRPEVSKTDAFGAQFQAKAYKLETSGVQWQGQALDTGAKGVELHASKGWIHYQCGPGYAEEFPYATGWPYLAPRTCVSGGVQFQVENQATRREGFQWQAKISELLPVGVQWQALIRETLPVGVQFASRREESEIEGLQWQSKISVLDTYGVQWQGKIYETLPVGIQFEQVSIKTVGIEVRIVNYNDTNLRILCEFPSRGTDGVNWTADSTASSSTNAFSVNNLNTDIVEQVWRNDGSDSATLTCDTQNPSGVFVDTVAILNHNLSGGADVLMQASDNGVSWINYANMLVEPENMYYIAPTLPLTPYRYWRFIINDPGSTVIQIGTIVFGSSIIFQGECFVDTVRFGKKQFADKVFTEGHTNISNDRGKKRFLGLEFTDLNFGKANFRNLRDVFDDAGTILKCLWIPTPKTPSRFAIFGKLDEIPEETHNTKGDDYVSLSVRVDESL